MRMCVCPSLLLLGFSSKHHDVIYFCDPLTRGKKVIKFNFGFLTKIFFRIFAALRPWPFGGLIPVRASQVAVGGLNTSSVN